MTNQPNLCEIYTEVFLEKHMYAGFCRIFATPLKMHKVKTLLHSL